MKRFAFLVFALTGLSAFAQNPGREIAPGAVGQLSTLLNNPAMVQPAVITPLGKSWFKLETDAHVISDEVTLQQVAATLVDLDNQANVFNGKKSKLTAQLVSRDTGVATFDFITTAFAPLGIQVKTPYRAVMRIVENSPSKVLIEVKQTDDDSLSNKNMQNMIASRYAEEIAIGGKTYTYIRIYTTDDVNTSILPGARSILENNSAPINLEAVQLIIDAAKTR